MSEKLHELLAFAFQKELGFTLSRSRSLAAYFENLEEFLSVTTEDLKNIRSVTGRRAINLEPGEIEKVLALKGSGLLSTKWSLEENFLRSVSRDFVRRQVNMIRSMSIQDLNPNPFLINALGLDSPKKFIQLNAYMLVTRSIVTSMGFFLQKLVIASSASVESGQDGWDAIKVDNDGKRHLIQVKSGTNDMDKDQVVYWAQKIEEALMGGNGGYIGMAYGKRSDETISLNLIKQHLPEWETKTLIGRELWDFAADNKTYHSQILEILRDAATQVLVHKSIVDEIEDRSNLITKDFVDRYGDGAEGVQKYIEQIF
jgi:hypothetical protein